jgi:hypothetical protein
MRIISTLLTADKPTKNGRIYSKETLQKAVLEYKKKVDDGKAIGFLGENSTNLSATSHRVTDIKIVNDDVIAEISILPTLAGDSLLKLFKSQELSFEIRGTGRIDDSTIRDLNIESIDATINYGTK